MASLSTKLIIAAALVATAGCSKKRPAELPPAPVGSETSGQIPGDGANGSGVGADGLPGSRADFLRSVSSDTVYFALDSYDIDGTARASLDSQAAWLARYPNVRITVEGHADERGTREYNLALGDRRANSAKNYLVAQGVPAERISIISYGKERPAELGSDEAAWARNRRAVTVTVN